MLKFFSLKAEGSTVSNSSDAKVDDDLAVELSFRQKMDKMFSDALEKKGSYGDIEDYKAKQEELDKFYSDRSESTWRQRLSIMWANDEYGMYSPELIFVKQATELGLLLGMCYGAYHESAKAHRIFLEQNKYTMFQHPREAQRALQDRYVLAMMQGGWRSGWRMGVLAFTFTSVVQSLVVIRTYINPLDYAIGGAAMGAVYRFNMGPKGMLGAGIGGALVGFQGGVLTWGLQKLSGETVAEKWEREYEAIRQGKELKIERIHNQDGRREIVIEEENRVKFPSPDVNVESEPEKDWVRDITIKITEWMENIGLLKGHSNDTFRISNDAQVHSLSKTSIHRVGLNNTGDIKLDLENSSDSIRTQPERNDRNL